MSTTPEPDPALAGSGPHVTIPLGETWPVADDIETTADDRSDYGGLAAALRAFLATHRPAAPPPAHGLCEAAAALVVDHLAFDAADPGWPDRDRVVASPDMQDLLDGALALAGHAIDAAAAAEAQPARIAAMPGLGAAVGMALAERTLAQRFGRSLVDHRTWMLAGPSDLSDGASHEAASLAGEWKLERLAVLWDAGRAVSVDDTLRRFAAYGWATRALDPGDAATLDAALGTARRARKPTLLACRGDHGEAPAAAAETAALPAWRAAGTARASTRRGWLKRLAHHPRRAEFERVHAGALVDGLGAAFERLRDSVIAAREPLPTCAAIDLVAEALLPSLPELLGGTADSRPGAATDTIPAFVNGACSARWLRLGAREHGLAAVMDGVAQHGGLLPVGVTVCSLGQALRPALWRAARLGLRLVHVLACDDSQGADPADHLAADQLASLRAVPNLLVLHPADALETVECWEVALRRRDGPSLLVVSREARPPLRAAGGQNCSQRGGYVLAEAAGPRRASLIAAGSAVALAMAVRARLAAQRISVAVVSLPCWALFAGADAAYRAQVLGDVPRFAIEPGTGFGWERWLGEGGVFIGAAAEGQWPRLTAEAIAGMIRERLSD